MLAQVCTWSPVKMPFLSRASFATVTWSRPWESVTDDSERVATHFAGRFNARATQGVMTSSG